MLRKRMAAAQLSSPVSSTLHVNIDVRKVKNSDPWGLVHLLPGPKFLLKLDPISSASVEVLYIMN